MPENEIMSDKNIKRIGFYIYYYGDDNKFPYQGIVINMDSRKVLKTIPWLSEKEDFDKTEWCGFCIKDDITCYFHSSGRGIPLCYLEKYMYKNNYSKAKTYAIKESEGCAVIILYDEKENPKEVIFVDEKGNVEYKPYNEANINMNELELREEFTV